MICMCLDGGLGGAGTPNYGGERGLVAILVQALQGPGPPTVHFQRFLSHPESPGDPTDDEWLSDFDVFVRQRGVSEGERAVVLVDYLGGCAREEVLCHPEEVRRDFGALVSLLRRVFGPRDTVASLQAEFYARMQSVGDSHSTASTHRKRSTHGDRAPGPGSPWRRRS